MPPADDVLPSNRIVRWLLLAGVVLFSVGLFFRFGLNVAPLGSVSPTPTPTAPTAR